MNNQRKRIQVFDHFWNKTEYTTWNMFFPWFEKGQLLQKIKKTSLLIYCLHDIILRNCSYPRQQAYYLILLMLWPEPIYAPINVKPATGGGGGGRRRRAWGGDLTFFKFAVKFPANGQIIPVECNQIFPPRAAHCYQISQGRTQERHNENISK